MGSLFQTQNCLIYYNDLGSLGVSWEEVLQNLASIVGEKSSPPPKAQTGEGWRHQRGGALGTEKSAGVKSSRGSTGLAFIPDFCSRRGEQETLSLQLCQTVAKWIYYKLHFNHFYALTSRINIFLFYIL